MSKDPNATAERYEGDTQERSWDANVKHTYDERAALSVNALKQHQSELARMNAQVESELARLNSLTLSALERSNNVVAQAQQNAVENANLAAKQAIKHADVAMDALWNPIQQSAADALTVRAVSIDDASLKAIGAVVASAVSSALTAK